MRVCVAPNLILVLIMPSSFLKPIPVSSSFITFFFFQRREAEQEARWARQRGLLPANPSTATADYDSDGSSGSGNSSDGGDCKGARQQRRTTGRGAPFYHRLYFSSAAVAPPAPLPTQHDGREKGELRHPLLGRDQLSAVQEGEGEEEAEWAEAKDAMDARDLGAALAARV